jgi:iron complex outermembrane receptor protein
MLPINEVPWKRRAGAILTLAGVVFTLPALAAGNASRETEELIGLSLEELLQVQVTTLSRRPQTLSNSPAAVFVITDADIQKSGARTLPDVLRMVPGVQVAQVDGSTWAVTARGSNGVFANKLLVLQDGRSLYGPMYSGVRWEAQDTDLASIERIEVIRGPGAVMWGSNAVNGVINIITKDAADTHGVKADVAVGNYTNFETNVRWGGALGEHTDYRLFAKYFDRDGYADSNYDALDFARLGGRLDWRVSDRDTLRLTSEIYDGDVGENFTRNSLTPPYFVEQDVMTEPSGGFAVLNWSRTLSDDAGFSLQAYYDKADRMDVSPNEQRDTHSLDFQHHFRAGSRHDFVWGFEIRHSEDDTTGSETISLNPSIRTQRLYSGFIQDEINLYNDELYLTVGTKVEKNNFMRSHTEWSPNARLAWLATETTTLWASVAKAIRTPNRIEQNVRILGGVVPPFTPPDNSPVPFAIAIHGNPDFGQEQVVAYELGFRTQPNQDLAIDVALFFNDYKDLRWGENLGISCQPAGLPISDPACFFGPFDYAELGVTFVNQGRQDNKGAELTVSYAPTEWWRLSAAYTYLKIDGDDFSNLPLSFGEDAPEHQLSLRSNMNVLLNGEVDLWLRYVDELPIQQVSSYVTLDARLGWQVTESLHFAVIGRNLLESNHLEFREEFGSNATVEVQREALAELVWQF